MTEDRRTVKYYAPRVLIPYDKVFSTTTGPYWLLICEADMEVLNCVLRYARRQVNWIVGNPTSPNTYLAPSEVEMEAINDLLDDLEGRLLMPICDSELIDAIDAIAGKLEALNLCVCALQANTQTGTAGLPEVQGYVDNGDVTYDSEQDTKGSPSPPASDELRCEYAQSVYWYVYQLYTETLLPFAKTTTDKLTSAIVAGSVFAGLAGWLGLPIAVLSGLVATVINWGVDGSIEDFVNWLLANKHEITCTLYTWIPDYNAAAAAMRGFIDAQEDLSFLDKQVLKAVLGSSWHYTWIIKDQQINGTYDAYIEAGYCEDCEEPEDNCQDTDTMDEGDFTGGSVEYHEAWGGVAVIGGFSYFNAGYVFCPSPDAWLQVYWKPRGDVGETAKCKFGLRRVDTGFQAEWFFTPDRPLNVAVLEDTPVPAQFIGAPCYLVIKQEVNYCQPLYYCLLDAEP